MRHYTILFAALLLTSKLLSQCEVPPFTVTVRTNNGSPLKDVNVSVTGNNITKTLKTDEHGKVSLGTDACINLSFSIDYTLDYLDGVSTLDLVRIQRHILGIQPFKNKYNLAAADCNDNGSVTASDLAELRKLIMGITSKLPAPTHRFLWEDDPFHGMNSEVIIFDIKKSIKDNNINIFLVKTGDIVNE
jgi:Dockerin type I domain